MNPPTSGCVLSRRALPAGGEASAFSIGSVGYSADAIAAELEQLGPLLAPLHPLNRQAVHAQLERWQISSPVRAAVDTALHDWLGQHAGLPLWQLWGLDLEQIGPTSVTIGISSPTAAQQRLHDWLQQDSFTAVKVKLGSPAGIGADQAMLLAILEALPPATKLSVDANGGWSSSEALTMVEWLADHQVTYVEQPLAVGAEAELAALYQNSPLPIFVDESCFSSRDLPALAGKVHGINIKLMKAGGLTEALNMIQTARAHDLQIMFGCYSDTSLANTALAHLSPLADHLDLDSHLNLLNDPFRGAYLASGRLIPPSKPGLGLTHHEA